MRDEPSPELRHDPGGTDATRELEAGLDDRAPREHRTQSDELALERAEAGAVQRGPRDDRGQEGRLGDDERGLERAQAAGDGQMDPSGPARARPRAYTAGPVFGAAPVLGAEVGPE